MNKNMSAILLLIVGLLIGIIIGWLVFGSINTTGNATKGVDDSKMTSTIETIMARGITEDSSDATYVKNLLTSNGYITTDGRTYINKALETTTVLCYNQNNEDKSVGADCGSGSCSASGTQCTNFGCQMYEQGYCKCSFSQECTNMSGMCAFANSR